jgi:hypothetical protein
MVAVKKTNTTAVHLSRSVCGFGFAKGLVVEIQRIHDHGGWVPSAKWQTQSIKWKTQKSVEMSVEMKY